ncbi:coproporphyrinogen III oxidase [Taibaiella sp. KBW10]|uniref:radical SAM family heme chaperone HemW n=1 Tax=Taibaiella sp. KBW10 TaxID=2153357 RepID=UPI000F5B1E6E|nr:radical SAM family heme chaperone HemW [Taibaiella sp. KBW10]RQO30085.1 coproporphyrinogen III oxidase [Taibaiella sp. KBW10]
MAGIYIHIPFCKQACNYCNFHFSTSLRQKDEVVAAICKELVLRKDYLYEQVVETVYFGGGTPSLLDEGSLMQIWETIFKHYPKIALKEATLEANPDDMSRDYAQMLRRTPTNRLSMGVQSFFEQDLRFMQRAHTANEAETAIKRAQDAGFDDMTIDLIYGTPGLTNTSWRENMLKAIQFQIPHISAYALTVEEKTLLAHQIEKGKAPAPLNEQAAQQFELMEEMLPMAGFDHYEISNFALPGKYALHNTNYWKGVHYLGIGPSAHSFNGHSRQWNVANNSLYVKGIETNLPNEELEILSPEDQINEYILTSLRTMWGIDMHYVGNRFGKEIKQALAAKMIPFLLGQVQQKDEQYTLTKAGKLFADGIAADLFF